MKGRLWIGFGIIVTFCLLFLLPSVGGTIEFIFRICFGWIRFLFIRLGEIQVNSELLFGSLLGFVCLFVVFHWVMKAFYNRSDESGTSLRSWRLRWTSAFIVLLMFLFMAGITVIGITHQTVWLIRSPEPILENRMSGPARTMSQNNLKQIGLAAHFYEENNHVLPPGSIINSKGIPLHGWQTLLLPHMEQDNLFKQIHLQRSWKEESNRVPFSSEIDVYIRPIVNQRKDEQGYALSHYAGNVHVMGGDRKRSFKDFKQGTSNTIYAAEVFANFKPWGHPTNYRDPKLGLNRSPDGFGSGNHQPTAILMLDGSIRTFQSDTDPEFLKLLSGKPDQ
jgi:hypothetical protein